MTTELVAYNKFFDRELPVLGSYYKDGMIRYIYADGLEALADLTVVKSRGKYQSVVIFDGPTGRGKSTAAIHFFKHLNPRWKIADGYVYEGPDLWKMVKNDKARFILIDEGSLVLNSKNSMKREDVAMATMFDLMRVLGKTTAICAPKYTSINRHIRETHTDYLCRCPVYSPIPGCDPRGFLDIYEHMKRDWGEDYYRLICTTTFKPLGEKLQAQYDEIKQAAIRRAAERLECASS